MAYLDPKTGILHGDYVEKHVRNYDPNCEKITWMDNYSAVPSLIIRFQLLNGGLCPSKAHATDAGFDCYANEEVTFYAGEQKIITLGFAVEIPTGYYGSMQGRSSMAFKHNFMFFSGTVDSEYRGEVKACMRYMGEYPYTVKKGDRIYQMLILPVPNCTVEIVDSLSDSDRGSGGFGSTGK